MLTVSMVSDPLLNVRKPSSTKLDTLNAAFETTTPESALMVNVFRMVNGVLKAIFVIANSRRPAPTPARVTLLTVMQLLIELLRAVIESTATVPPTGIPAGRASTASLIDG